MKATPLALFLLLASSAPAATIPTIATSNAITVELSASGSEDSMTQQSLTFPWEFRAEGHVDTDTLRYTLDSLTIGAPPVGTAVMSAMVHTYTAPTGFTPSSPLPPVPVEARFEFDPFELHTLEDSSYMGGLRGTLHLFGQLGRLFVSYGSEVPISFVRDFDTVSELHIECGYDFTCRSQLQFERGSGAGIEWSDLYPDSGVSHGIHGIGASVQTVPVPEPSTVGLVAVVALSLASMRRWPSGRSASTSTPPGT